jgi:hypothetical protein
LIRRSHDKSWHRNTRIEDWYLVANNYLSWQIDICHFCHVLYCTVQKTDHSCVYNTHVARSFQLSFSFFDIYISITNVTPNGDPLLSYDSNWMNHIKFLPATANHLLGERSGRSSDWWAALQLGKINLSFICQQVGTRLLVLNNCQIIIVWCKLNNHFKRTKFFMKETGLEVWRLVQFFCPYPNDASECGSRWSNLKSFEWIRASHILCMLTCTINLWSLQIKIPQICFQLCF